MEFMLNTFSSEKSIDHNCKIDIQKLLHSNIYNNIDFLTENYQRLELEKKSRRIQKTVYRGPVIRYHSLTMPLIEEVQDNEINIEQDR